MTPGVPSSWVCRGRMHGIALRVCDACLWASCRVLGGSCAGLGNPRPGLARQTRSTTCTVSCLEESFRETERHAPVPPLSQPCSATPRCAPPPGSSTPCCWPARPLARDTSPLPPCRTALARPPPSRLQAPAGTAQAAATAARLVAAGAAVAAAAGCGCAGWRRPCQRAVQRQAAALRAARKTAMASLPPRLRMDHVLRRAGRDRQQ